jgi:hypothetical protein
MRTNIGRFVGSGRSNISQDYETANGWGVTFLVPEIPVFPLSYNPSTTGEQLYYNFLNVLNRSFSSANGWNITGSLAGLSNNSLQVTTYSALGSALRVGASFAGTYVPGVGDPTANIHWISDNNAITYPGGVATPNPGTLENKVDLARNNTTTPYYDTGTPVVATSRMFLDTSTRSSVEFDNTWVATLFLAGGPNTPGTAMNPATISVYIKSGIVWGWQNFFFTNVNEQEFIADVEQDVFADDELGVFNNVSLYEGTQDNGTLQTVSLDLIPTSDYAAYEASFQAGLVPEPSTWAMMLLGFAGLGYAGHRASRKAASIAA